MIASVRARLLRLREDEKGVVAVVFALLTPVLIGAAGFAVDGALMYAAQARLQVSADAAALAGARSLDTPGDVASKAQALADANIPGDSVLSASDVIPGRWDAGTQTFDAGAANPNAVRVVTRFAEANGNPHRLIFGAFLGMTEMDISATATALFEGGLACSGNILLFPDPTYVPPANARSVNTLGGPCGSPCPAGFKGPNGHTQTPEGHPVLRLDVGSATYAANPTQKLTVLAGGVNESYTLPGPGRWFVVVTSFTNPYDINDPSTKNKPKVTIVYSNFGAGTATWGNDIRTVMTLTQPPQCPANAAAVTGTGRARLVQ